MRAVLREVKEHGAELMVASVSGGGVLLLQTWFCCLPTPAAAPCSPSQALCGPASALLELASMAARRPCGLPAAASLRLLACDRPVLAHQHAHQRLPPSSTPHRCRARHATSSAPPPSTLPPARPQHNQQSIEIAVSEMERLGIPASGGGVYFGQLLGMADALTFTLGQNGCVVGAGGAPPAAPACALGSCWAWRTRRR